MEAFAWRRGSRFTSHDVQVVGARLEQIREKSGLTAENVVRDARKPTSPLHDLFNWDDSDAAHQYRLSQARDVTASVMVTRPGLDGPKEVRLYVHLNEGPNYEHVDIVLKAPDKRAIMLARAKRELQDFRRRFEDLEELVGVMEAIEKLGRDAA